MLQDIVLDFSPGPIQAVDGDRGLQSPVSYAILSGSTHINNAQRLKSLRKNTASMLPLQEMTVGVSCWTERQGR